MTLSFTRPTKHSELLEPQTSTDLPLERQREVMELMLWPITMATNSLALMTMTMISIAIVVHLAIQEDGGTTTVIMLISMALTQFRLLLELIQYMPG